MSNTIERKPGYVHGCYSPTPEYWGLIPEFLNADDPRPAWEQIQENYIGGWHEMSTSFLPKAEEDNGIRIEKTGDDYSVVFHYVEGPDPSIAWMRFRDEMLYIDSHEVVAIEYDGDWRVTRLN